MNFIEYPLRYGNRTHRDVPVQETEKPPTYNFFVKFRINLYMYIVFSHISPIHNLWCFHCEGYPPKQ